MAPKAHTLPPQPSGSAPVVGAVRETGRIEAFSDGVFAIAITLLVLDLKVPPVDEAHGGASLLVLLGRQWPTYVAFVISFFTILIMWINHHTLFTVISRTDHVFLVLNGLLLFGVTAVPFPTSLIADYVQYADSSTAAAVYTGTFVVIALFFNLLWQYASRGHRLLDPHADPALVRAITRGYRFGPLLYLVAFLAAFVNVAASLAICAGLALFFAWPRAVSES